MKTIFLWITLLVLHQGYALIPMTTVQLGESVTLTCLFPDVVYSNTRIKWYKQSTSDSLKLITTLMQTTEKPTFEQGFPSSRFDANRTITTSRLTILKTVQEDEAMYHCGVSTWNKDQWSSTYLSVKGNIQRMTIVQSPIVSDPLHPGDNVTLECSVNSEKKSCPGVHWFGVRSDKSHANIIYTDGYMERDECDQKPDAQSPPKECVYRFSKEVSSSDAGIYYCAVATCGEIIFGHGTKLDIEGTSFDTLDKSFPFLLCLVFAVIVTAFLIYAIKKNKCDCHSNKAAVSLQENAKINLKRDGDTGIYSAVVFTMMKTDSGQKRGTKDRERIYAAVKAFGLD